MELIPTPDSESFRYFEKGQTGIPLGDHPGAFGVKRKHHRHEGVDLYCPEGTLVEAVEDGVVVAVLDFTGILADPPSPWWFDTKAILIEGESGVVLYGEVTADVRTGQKVEAGELIGWVRQVLTKDKGRPMSMLHIELHKHGTRLAYDWIEERPTSLLNPTGYLLEIARARPE